jgi:hypothetical protein
MARVIHDSAPGVRRELRERGEVARNLASEGRRYESP